MAMALAVSSTNFIPTPTNKLPHSSLSPPATFSLTHISSNPKPPILSTYRIQFYGSAGEEGGAIEEPFFHDLVGEEGEESDEDNETESSVDLLMRFLQSMFRKVSKRAKRASRSVLPSAISPQLLSFAVDGVLLLAALSIVKALLEVVCTLGGTVFVVILILRVVWAAVSYFQSSGNSFHQGEGSFRSGQPVT